MTVARVAAQEQKSEREGVTIHLHLQVGVTASETIAMKLRATQTAVLLVATF